jgi:hypothetical protein
MRPDEQVNTPVEDHITIEDRAQTRAGGCKGANVAAVNAGLPFYRGRFP